MIAFANVLISVLFLAKLLWTAGIPIAMTIERRKLSIEDRERKGGVSLALPIDVLLLVALVSIAAVTGRGIFHLSALWLFVAGVGAILLSIGCCALIGLIVKLI